MRNLLLYLIILSPFFAQSQITFNKQFDAGYPFLAITSVYPTDSCYYASSVLTDTTGGLLTSGNAFFKFDLEGNIQIQKKLGTPTKSYQTWRADLIPTNDGNLMTIGLTNDTVSKGVIIKYNTQGDTIFTKEYFNPYYPEEYFLHPAAIRQSQQNEYWVLSGADSDPNGANGDIFLQNVDQTGEILSSYSYGNAQTDTPIALLVDEVNQGVIIGARKSNIGQVDNNFF